MSRIEHFAIFAADLETLRAFYEEALGLRVIVDNSRAPIRGYFLADDSGSVLEIIARPPHVPPADTRYVCHTAFLVEDYAAVRKALEHRGARFEADTEVDTDMVRTAFFNDPEGNRCQIVWRRQPLGS
jgi:catechol 2,3-dioxygenase-like lactoylglutathione lyase family enzyme